MIYVSDKAKDKVANLQQEANLIGRDDYFLRVSVVGVVAQGLVIKWILTMKKNLWTRSLMIMELK